MGLFKSFVYELLFKKYDDFAKILGYENWDTAMEHTFDIFELDDAGYCATQLPNKKWAVWSDVGQMPHPVSVFETWEEAILFLRHSFEKEGLPEENWEPEGFDEGEDVFSKEPDRGKRCDIE